jgi:hypothetical protein
MMACAVVMHQTKQARGLNAKSALSDESALFENCKFQEKIT